MFIKLKIVDFNITIFQKALKSDDPKQNIVLNGILVLQIFYHKVVTAPRRKQWAR